MIEVRNLTKKYGNTKVVDNVSLDIEKGKMISLIGPNGAGKSTVLSMIPRLMDMDEGQVIIDGTELSKWDSKELSKRISILKQANDVNLRLTIRELVEFGRFPHSQGNITAVDNEFIDKAIKYMQLEDIEHRYLDELSGGQKQRAYIAMVIAQDTEYIFLDEPLNNLDMKHCVQMMKVIRGLVDDLGKTVVTVLHDINFGMNKGEITGLIGPNGAGKSTMLKLMIKKMKPNNGKIIIGDNDIFSIKRENNPVTFIPDIPVYYEELTVWEHLQFIKALYPENSVTVDSLIREFNLNQHLNKIPSALSKGTLQKLMIALALLRQYDVLLADEPFNGLDPAQTYKFKNTLKNLKKQDKTILISTHLLSLAEDFCDRYIFLYDGRIVEQGTKTEILQKQQMNKETSLEQIYMSLIGEGEHYAGVQKTVMCE